MPGRRAARVSPACRPLRVAFKMAAEDLRLFFDCRCGVVAHYMSPAFVAGAPC